MDEQRVMYSEERLTSIEARRPILGFTSPGNSSGLIQNLKG